MKCESIDLNALCVLPLELYILIYFLCFISFYKYVWNKALN